MNVGTIDWESVEKTNEKRFFDQTLYSWAMNFTHMSTFCPLRVILASLFWPFGFSQPRERTLSRKTWHERHLSLFMEEKLYISPAPRDVKFMCNSERNIKNIALSLVTSFVCAIQLFGNKLADWRDKFCGHYFLLIMCPTTNQPKSHTADSQGKSTT